MSEEKRETPTTRLRKLLEEQLVAGDDIPGTTDRILPQIPMGDAARWMRPGVQAEIRRWAKEQGYVIDHAAQPAESDDDERHGQPLRKWVQLSIDEVVIHIKYVQAQLAEDDAALQQRLEVWCDANPDAEMTPDDLRKRAS